MLNSYVFALMVGMILGFLAGLGVGGGSLLILWLTMVLHTPAQEARLINLMFFIPAALISAFFNRKNQAFQYRTILPAIIAGCSSAIVFSRLSTTLDMVMLKRLFGILLLITGMRELLYRPRNAK